MASRKSLTQDVVDSYREGHELLDRAVAAETAEHNPKYVVKEWRTSESLKVEAQARFAAAQAAAAMILAAGVLDSGGYGHLAADLRRAAREREEG